VLVVLLVVSLLIISNTIRIGMYDRRDEIAIMRMVGATNSFIRLPFVVEGFILGMTGAGIAFALQWALYDALLVRIAAVDVLQMFELVPSEQLLLPMAIVFGAAGMFVGILGSHTSIRKFLNV
jgi:cell division transport system permease protein